MKTFINERVSKLYCKFISTWVKEHNEGKPPCFNEWYDNEYTKGYTTERYRVGNNKKLNTFYTKIFFSGRTKITRADFETLPVPMDTYDFTDEDMQAIAHRVNAELIVNFGADYDLKDEDTEDSFWDILEWVGTQFGMNYYEDYDMDIIE